MVSRADRSRFAEWFWTVDHYLLAAFSILLVSGVVFAFAASPPVAERIGVDTFYFVKTAGHVHDPGGWDHASGIAHDAADGSQSRARVVHDLRGLAHCDPVHGV